MPCPTVYVKRGVVLFESVILPGPIQPGANESTSSIDALNSIFKWAPENDIVDVSEKTMYAPKEIESDIVFVCCFGKKTTEGGYTPSSSFAVLSFGLSSSLSYIVQPEEKNRRKKMNKEKRFNFLVLVRFRSDNIPFLNYVFFGARANNVCVDTIYNPQ